MEKFTKVYLGVGSNLGDRKANLAKARSLLQKFPATRFLRGSSIFETDPVGGPPQGKFLNAVWEVETALLPGELRKELQTIEARLGRKRGERNAPREIDLDILFYGDRIVEERELQIPHPRLHERAFVLLPLSELAPELEHRILKKTVKELLEMTLRHPERSEGSRLEILRPLASE